MVRSFENISKFGAHHEKNTFRALHLATMPLAEGAAAPNVSVPPAAALRAAANASRSTRAGARSQHGGRRAESRALGCPSRRTGMARVHVGGRGGAEAIWRWPCACARARVTHRRCQDGAQDCCRGAAPRLPLGRAHGGSSWRGKPCQA